MTNPLTAVHYLGSSADTVTTEQCIDVTINVINSAKRRWRITHVSELSPKRRENFMTTVNNTLKMLGVNAIVAEWREERQDARLME